MHFHTLSVSVIAPEKHVLASPGELRRVRGSGRDAGFRPANWASLASPRVAPSTLLQMSE